MSRSIGAPMAFPYRAFSSLWDSIPPRKDMHILHRTSWEGAQCTGDHYANTVELGQGSKSLSINSDTDLSYL